MYNIDGYGSCGLAQDGFFCFLEFFVIVLYFFYFFERSSCVCVGLSQVVFLGFSVLPISSLSFLFFLQKTGVLEKSGLLLLFYCDFPCG